MTNFLYTLIIYPIVQIIEFVFVFAQKVFKETGVSVMCVSAAISILCLPLYMVAESWQEVERGIQKRLKSKIDKIKAVFKGTDMTFMSNADVPVLALHNQNVLEKNPFAGNFITTEDKNHPLYIALSGGIHLEYQDATTIWLDDTRNFYVHDNIFDEKNWVRASK